MKFLIFFLISTNSFALDFFTSVAAIDEAVFAGIKSKTKNEEVVSSLLVVKGNVPTKIDLPKDQDGREIVALVPMGKNLAVVSQLTAELGDNPIVLSFNPNSKKWSTLGSADCKAFDKIEKTKGQLNFHCETPTQTEEVKKSIVSVSLGIIDSQDLQISFPQDKAKSDKTQAELVGPSYAWKKLKVTLKGKSALIDIDKIKRSKPSK